MKKAFVAICILALLGMVGWKLTENFRKEKDRANRIVATSDAAKIKHQITIMGDEWLGYLIFRSPEFYEKLAEKEIGARFVMEPDFRKRFDAMAAGKCDIACATIDSFLVNARESNYPGVILFGIDESYGGDALLVNETKIKSLDDLKNPELKGAFVGFSPSEFLLKSQISHFGIEALLPNIDTMRTNDADAAYQKFSAGEVDFAVLWEPLVSRALENIPESKRLIDTKAARGIVIDVAIASRDLVAQNPEIAQEVTNAYFESLQFYLNNQEAFKNLAKNDSGESKENAEAMLAGIRFLDHNENSRNLRLADSVSAITQILIDVNDLTGDPLNGNPRTVLNSTFLSNVNLAFSTPNAGNPDPLAAKGGQRYFRKLSAADWERLSENITGTLLEKPVIFGTGQATIPEEFEADLHRACAKMIHYPNHRVIVQAHVSPGSDPAVDLELSQQRANAIRTLLVEKCGVNSERILAVGKGGAEPVVKEEGEGLRAWKRRCRRARIFIAEDT
ncbi:MAG: OmpA family protein [Verrucomicrobiales bacterium]|nr:OmpA family protein [Verrucomicrobiales bacterium]